MNPAGLRYTPSPLHVAAALLGVWALGHLPRTASAGLGVAAAQERPIPVSLAKRLAEVADEYRTGETIWIVASYNPWHDVAGVFTSQAEARRVAATRPGFDAFGPYATFQDADRVPMLAFGCHIAPMTYWICPFDPPGPAIRFSQVDSIRVTIFARETTPFATTLKRDREKLADALFFTLPAVDKFAVPYYARLFGLDYARDLRNTILRYTQTGR